MTEMIKKDFIKEIGLWFITWHVWCKKCNGNGCRECTARGHKYSLQPTPLKKIKDWITTKNKGFVSWMKA